MVENNVKVTTLDLSPENGIGPTERRFSKVNNKVCKLKMKIFSCDGVAKEVEYKSESDINPVKSIELEEKSFSNSGEEQKSYSVASLRERLREAKFSARQKFRRLCIDHKKFFAMVKEKISQDDFKLLKGLLASDIMNILNIVTPEIIKGKQINTLLGLSALSKSLREAGTRLTMPMRLGLTEEKRTGAVTKKRYQDLSEAYNDFIKSVFEYCYGDNYNEVGVTEVSSAGDSLDEGMKLDNIKV